MTTYKEEDKANPLSPVRCDLETQSNGGLLMQKWQSFLLFFSLPFFSLLSSNRKKGKRITEKLIFQTFKETDNFVLAYQIEI